MAEQHADPVTRPGLHVVTGIVTGDATGPTGSAEPPVTTGAVVPMSARERTGSAVTHWAGTAADGAGQLWLNPGRVLHVLWHGKPESMAEHRAYIRSRAWVPPELTGKSAAVITVAGILYHLLIARPVKTAARIVDGAADRPLRLLLLAVFVAVLALVLLNL